MRWPRFFAILTVGGILVVSLYARRWKQTPTAPTHDAGPVTAPALVEADAGPRPATVIAVDAGSVAGPVRVVTTPPDAAPIADLLGRESDTLTAPREVWDRQVLPKFARYLPAEEALSAMGMLMDMCQQDLSMVHDDATQEDTEATHAMLDAMRENHQLVMKRVVELSRGRLTKADLRAIITSPEFGEACANVPRPSGDAGP